MSEIITVTASAVRADFTRLLAACAAGSTVHVTKHGRVVAVMMSPVVEEVEEVEEAEEAEEVEEAEEPQEVEESDHIWGWTSSEEEAFERFLEENEEENGLDPDDESLLELA